MCNQSETPLADCINKDNARSVDNAGGNDWLLLLFDTSVNLTDFTVSPDVGSKNKAQGRDVTYFTGTLSSASEIDGKTYDDLVNTLGLDRTDVNNGKSTVSALIDINAQAGTEVWGNAILIGASAANGGDRIMLSSMTTTVPVPPAVWLFASALAFLGRCRRS